KTKLLGSPEATEATEIAKFTETTYFGLMIAWAQRSSAIVQNSASVTTKSCRSTMKLNSFRRRNIFWRDRRPLRDANIDILLQKFPSDLLQAIVQSNALKQKNPAPDGRRESNADRQR